MTKLEDAIVWGETCWINLAEVNINRIRLLARASMAVSERGRYGVCPSCMLPMMFGDVHSVERCTIMDPGGVSRVARCASDGVSDSERWAKTAETIPRSWPRPSCESEDMFPEGKS